MASESGDRTLSRQWTRQPEPKHLPCPRCESTHTKFCYYNNYNLSQPRHFCKSCRRYWTRGGALRNVPVGGGTREAHFSNKRPRVASPSTRAAAPTSPAGPVSRSPEESESAQKNPGPLPLPELTDEVNLNEVAARTGSDRNPSSWLGGQIATSDGLFPLNMFGVGLGYEPGMSEWPMEHMGGGNGAFLSESPGGNTWQLTGGGEDGGAAIGDYLSWPELSIPAPAKTFK